MLVLDGRALYRDHSLFKCCHDHQQFPLHPDLCVVKPQPIDHQFVRFICQVSLIEAWGTSLGSKLSSVTCQANKMS